MQALLSEWGPSDSRGVSLLIALALVSAIAGFIAYFETQDVRWAFGALIIIASWLYAFFVMSPLDNQIRSLRGGDVAAARALVRQWGIVELGLTAIGAVAVLVFLVGPPLSGAPHGLGLARPLRSAGATSPTRCASSPACAWASRSQARRSTLTASPGRRRSPASRSASSARSSLRSPRCSACPCSFAPGWRRPRSSPTTGALHEDGLADVADGFGGGATRARKLEIMRDSRIGAYGAIAIALALILRVGALAAALDGGFWRAALSLMLVAALSRAAALTPLALLPPARADGAGAAAGRLDSNALAAAWGSALVIASRSASSRLAWPMRSSPRS